MRAAPSLLLSVALAIVIALALGFALTVGTSTIPLTDPDEARYAATSRNMLERADFVVPWFNGAERINKPPLLYWLQAATFRTLGVSEFMARLPSLLAAVALLLTVAWFASREMGPRRAAIAGLILLATPLFFLIAKGGVIDMLLVACQTPVILLWYRQYRRGGQARFARGPFIAIGLLLGLGILAKGPVALIVPMLVLGVFLLIRGDRHAVRIRGAILGSALVSAVVLPWLALLVWRLGGAALAHAGAPASGAQILMTGLRRTGELLHRETIERALSGLEHPQPVYYFLVAGLLVFFPWCAYAPFAGAVAARRARTGEPLALLLLVWIVVVFVFFSLMRGKLVTYILPACPPLALLLAMVWPGSSARGRESSWIKRGTATLAVLAAAFVAFTALYHGEYAVLPQIGWVVGGAAVLLLAAVLPIAMGRPQHAASALALVSIGSLSAILLLGGERLGRARSLKEIVEATQIGTVPWARVLTYRLTAPSLVFYGRSDVGFLRDPHELAELATPGSLIVLETHRAKELPAALLGKLIPVALQSPYVAMSVGMPPGRDPNGTAVAHGGLLLVDGRDPPVNPLR